MFTDSDDDDDGGVIVVTLMIIKINEQTYKQTNKQTQEKQVFTQTCASSSSLSPAKINKSKSGRRYVLRHSCSI